jgi:hypothetical protein
MSDLLSDEQLTKLRAEYAHIQTIDPAGPTYPKLCTFLDGLPDSRLCQLAGAGVKFLSMLARNRCVTRGLSTQGAAP